MKHARLRIWGSGVRISSGAPFSTRLRTLGRRVVARKDRFLKDVVASLHPDLAVINFNGGDGCKQAFRKGAEPVVKFSFTMRLKRSINGGSIRI